MMRNEIRQNGRRLNLNKLLAFSIALVCCYPLHAQDARTLVQQTVNVEIAKDRADRSRWIYFEVDKKSGNTIEQWVAQTSRGDVNRVIKKNSKPIPLAQQQQAVQSFIHNADAQAQQGQNDKKDAQQAESLLKMLPDAFLWSMKEKNDITTTFHFKPNPDFSPPSRQARVFAAMEGDMTVNNQQHRIMKLKGVMIRDVNFGWGLLGSLKKGGSFEVGRKQTSPGIWQIYETHVHIQGRALLFKTISQQEDDYKSSFTRLPGDITLQQAAQEVMKKPNGPE